MHIMLYHSVRGENSTDLIVIVCSRMWKIEFLQKQNTFIATPFNTPPTRKLYHTSYRKSNLCLYGIDVCNSYRFPIPDASDSFYYECDMPPPPPTMLYVDWTREKITYVYLWYTVLMNPSFNLTNVLHFLLCLNGYPYVFDTWESSKHCMLVIDQTT